MDVGDETTGLHIFATTQWDTMGVWYECNEITLLPLELRICDVQIWTNPTVGSGENEVKIHPPQKFGQLGIVTLMLTIIRPE
jgi:hypothetical protein